MRFVCFVKNVLNTVVGEEQSGQRGVCFGMGRGEGEDTDQEELLIGLLTYFFLHKTIFL